MKKCTQLALLGIVLQLLTINTFSQWIEWEKHSVFDPYENRSFCVKISNDGNILVCGDRYLGGYIYKANQSGDSIWTCLYARGYTLTDDNLGNVYSIDLQTLFKVTSAGILVWQKELTDPLYSSVYGGKIIRSLDNYIIIAGSGFSDSLKCGYICKYDLNGNRVWSNAIKISGRNYSIKNISQSEDGTILAIGDVRISNNVLNFIAKFSVNGELIFEKIFGDNNTLNKSGNSVFQLVDKSFLAFTSLGYRVGDSRLVITKLDSSGNYSWRKFYGDTNNLYHLWLNEGIIKDKFKNQFLVAGSKPSNSFDTNYCSLASYDSLGNLLWEKMTYSDSFPSYFNSIAQNDDSSFVICGEAFKNFGLTDLSSPKYLHLLKTKKINPIGISNIGTEIPNRFTLHQNHPNPFNPNTKIKFDIPKSSNIEFNVFDVLGRKVYSAFYNRPVGSYEIDFDGSGFSSGIYFYSIKAGEYYESRKMILIK